VATTTTTTIVIAGAGTSIGFFRNQKQKIVARFGWRWQRVLRQRFEKLWL
jgi:hypothetical protein